MAMNLRTQPENDYSYGYSNGFKDGYNKAIQQLGDMIYLNTLNPQVIVTTKENMDALREQYKNKKSD
jgi:hypothetical protein